MARIVAKALNCTTSMTASPTTVRGLRGDPEGRALDVLEMDAASNNLVDDMRDLLRAS